jgi:hydroxymethylbilane synthase
MEDQKEVRIGTRGSALARRQTELVSRTLRERFPTLQMVVETVSTRGDRVQDRPIAQLGDKGVFIREIEALLLDGRIDLAVHSLKDVPADVDVPGLALAAFSEREDPRDVVISRGDVALLEMPSGARVGTSSPRRRALLAAVRPDLVAADIRGNVDTRLRKLREGQYDAIILAAAGLRRLGLEAEVTEYLSPDIWLPDGGQGIMVLQGRVGDPATNLAAAIDCWRSRLMATAERAVSRALGAGCNSPVGALARIEGDVLVLDGVAAGEDLRTLQRVRAEGPVDEAERIGLRAGSRLAAALGREPRLY